MPRYTDSPLEKVPILLSPEPLIVIVCPCPSMVILLRSLDLTAAGTVIFVVSSYVTPEATFQLESAVAPAVLSGALRSVNTATETTAIAVTMITAVNAISQSLP